LVSAETGDGIWFQEFPPVTGEFALVDGAVVIPALGDEASLNAGEGGSLIAFDLGEAEERWSQPIVPGTYPWVSVADGLLYVGRDDGIVQVLDPARGEERRSLDPAASARGTVREDRAGSIQDDRGGFIHLAVAGGQVYALGENGIVYAIGAAGGAGTPVAMPATPVPD
jgi:outer membrane protein assembly factor BamB